MHELYTLAYFLFKSIHEVLHPLPLLYLAIIKTENISGKIHKNLYTLSNTEDNNKSLNYFSIGSISAVLYTFK